MNLIFLVKTFGVNFDALQTLPDNLQRCGSELGLKEKCLTARRRQTSESDEINAYYWAEHSNTGWRHQVPLQTSGILQTS